MSYGTQVLCVVHARTRVLDWAATELATFGVDVEWDLE